MAVTINIPSQVKTYANLAAFPASGSLKTIYIAEDTNKTYRWTGSVYVEISASAAMTWGQIGGTLSNQTDLQNALDAKVPTTRTLTINGVVQDLSADRSWTISTGLTVGTTPIASGTIGRVLFQGTGNVLQQSANLFWDDVNGRAGIGTSTPSQALTIANGNITLTSTGSASINIGTGGYPKLSLNNRTAIQEEGPSQMSIGRGYTSIVFQLSNSEIARFVGGNLLLNTTTDAGFRLDVNGTARINTLTVGLGGGQQSTNTAVGVTALNANTTGVSNTAIGFEALLLNSTASGNTALGRRALRATTGASNIAIGNGAMENNTSGVANIGIGEGAGNVNTTGGSNIFIGNWSSGVVNNGVNRTWIGNSSTTSTYLAGNVLINTTTDAGFRLDVNGTARVQGNITQSGANTAALGYITNGTLGVYSNTPSATTIGLLIGCVANGGHTAIFTKGNNSGSTALRVTDQNVGASVNHFIVDFVGASGFGIANGTTTVNASAQVEIQSTTKGFLPPRMTTTQRNAIASPAAGLIVYDTTLNLPHFFNGTIWVSL
jgi:hypothetical protein